MYTKDSGSEYAKIYLLSVKIYLYIFLLKLLLSLKMYVIYFCFNKQHIVMSSLFCI